MSKSIYNNLDLRKGCCSSKSLTNSGQFSSGTDRTITQFITSQNQTPSSGGGSTSNDLTTIIDNLTINNNLGVGGTASINKTITNSLTIGTGSLTFSSNVIGSSMNIVLNPNNPSACEGFVSIEDNLKVGGCFTDLCTFDTFIRDSVPTINVCRNSIPIDDNNDVGIQMTYVEPNTDPNVINNAFIGLSRRRFQAKGPRFAMWYDTNTNIPDKNFNRSGTQPNGLDIDNVYTYLITNPDDPNAPPTLGGYSKFDINVLATDEFIVTSLKQKHDAGWWETHNVGTIDATKAGFRVEDETMPACNFIELGQPGFAIPGGKCAADSNAGLFMWHNDNVDIYACTGTVKIGPRIAGNDGTPGVGGTAVVFIDDISIEPPRKLLTNTIVERNSNLTIQTQGATHDISIISIDQIKTTSVNQTIITASNNANGTIELVSSGFNAILYPLSNGGVQNYNVSTLLHTNNNRDIVLDTSSTGNILLYSSDGTIRTDANQTYIWSGELLSLRTFDNNSSVDIMTNGTNSSIDIMTNSTTSNINLITNDGNITMSASGSNRLVEVFPGMRFINNIISNPSIGANRQRTMWYDNTGGIGSNTSNIKTFYPIAPTGDFPFVVSASQNNATSNKLAMYHDNSGWCIEKTNIDVIGGDSLSLNNLTVNGILTAMNINNEVCANHLKFVEGTNMIGNPIFNCIQTHTYLSGAASFPPIFVPDAPVLNVPPPFSFGYPVPPANFVNLGRMMFIRTMARLVGIGPLYTCQNVIDFSESYVQGSGVRILQYTPGANPENDIIQWVPPGGGGSPVTLQMAYDNYGGSSALINLDYSSGPDGITISANGTTANNGESIFRVRNTNNIQLFRINEITNNDPSIVILPQDAGANRRALEIQDDSNNSKIIFTPNSSGKIATFNGDIDVTGTIDPIGIVFDGQPNRSLINPPNPGGGNGTIYVRNQQDFGINPNTSGLLFVETNIGGPFAPRERPVILFDVQPLDGGNGYYQTNVYGPNTVSSCIPVFTNGFGNKMTSSRVIVDSSQNITNVNHIETNTLAKNTVIVSNVFYIIQSNESIILYNGVAPALFTLPSIVIGKELIIMNDTVFTIGLLPIINDISGNGLIISANRSAILIGANGNWNRVT